MQAILLAGGLGTRLRSVVSLSLIHILDMYKKILAGQLDALKAELERERQQREALTGESGQEDTGSGEYTGAGTEETETDGSRAGAGTKSGDVEMSDFSGDVYKRQVLKSIWQNMTKKNTRKP